MTQPRRIYRHETASVPVDFGQVSVQRERLADWIDPERRDDE